MADFEGSDKWIRTGSNIYNTNSDGSVGVGEKNPTEKLTVSGNLLVQGVVRPEVKIVGTDFPTAFGRLAAYVGNYFNTYNASFDGQDWQRDDTSRGSSNFNIGTGALRLRVARNATGSIVWSESLYADVSGVGIGTTTPTGKFHISGIQNAAISFKVSASGAADALNVISGGFIGIGTINNVDAQVSVSGATGGRIVRIHGPTGGSPDLLMISGNGAFGQGIFPTTEFHVQRGQNLLSKFHAVLGSSTLMVSRTTTSQESSLVFSDGGVNSDWKIGTTPGATTLRFVSLDGVTRIHMTSGAAAEGTAGRLGLNTISPTARLHISGPFDAVSLRVDASGGATALSVISGGNVGIGTVNPSQKLTISDNILWGGNGEGILTWLTNNAAVMRANGGNHLRLQSSGGAYEVKLDYLGNFGVGTGSPASILHVSTGSAPLRLDASGTKAITATSFVFPSSGPIYGGTGSFLGDPAIWININVSGTVYKVPGFL